MEGRRNEGKRAARVVELQSSKVPSGGFLDPLGVYSLERRRAEQVEALLAGEHTDMNCLAFEVDAWHIAVIATGPDAELAIRDLATAIDRRLLLLPRAGGITWAWLSGRRRIDCSGLLDAASLGGTTLSLAVGEPGEGLVGWRLTHRQAVAAHPIACRAPGQIIRYADVALLASLLQDEVLSQSLNDLYLAPLKGERDGGERLRQTLRAYFATERNASSAAAALGVSRNTIGNRLKTIEVLLGRQLSSCAPDIEAALRLEELEGQRS